MFSNKIKEKICRNSITKTKSKDLFKGIASSKIDPYVGAPFPAVAGGVATDDLSLASKVLTSPEVRNLSLPAAKNLLVLQDLPQVHPLVKSLFPEDLQCRYPLAGRLKYFRKNWEKLSSKKLYCFELQDV